MPNKQSQFNVTDHAFWVESITPIQILMKKKQGNLMGELTVAAILQSSCFILFVFKPVKQFFFQLVLHLSHGLKSHMHLSYCKVNLWQ